MDNDEQPSATLTNEQRQCIGKRRHESEFSARNDMHITMLSPFHVKKGRSMLHVYLCDYCGYWHHGAVAFQPWVKRTHVRRDFPKPDKPKRLDGKVRPKRRRDKWSMQ